MPDISNADLVGLAGTFLAAFVGALGLKKGGSERETHTAPSSDLAAGVFVGMDAATEKSILEELRGMHTDMVQWRREDQDARRANELQDARAEASDLRAELGRLRDGQKVTHESNDAIRGMLAELLSDPEVADRARRIRETPKSRNARLAPPGE